MKFCPYCGKSVEGDHRFCSHCGAALTTSENTAPTAVQAPSNNQNQPVGYATSGKSIVGIVFGTISMMFSFISLYFLWVLAFIALTLAIPAIATSCSSRAHPGIRIPSIVIATSAMVFSIIAIFCLYVDTF